MSRIVLCIWLLIISMACGPSRRVERPPVVHDQEWQRSASVALVTDTRRVFCTGVWTGDIEFVTAHHCVSDKTVGSAFLYAQYSDISRPVYEVKETHVARLMRVAPGHDLAVLKVLVAPHPHSFAKVGHSVADGEPVGVVGHPHGLLYTWMPGTVSRTVWMDNMLTVQVTVPAWFGNSGGGAFNEQGELVGIASFLTNVPGQTFFVHPEYVHEILE